MRGQPKRLSRSYRRRNGGKANVYVLISFHSRYVPCILSRLFVLLVCFVFIWLLIFLVIYSIFRSLITQSLTATPTSTIAVSVCYNSLFICLPLFGKGQKQRREKATFFVFERTWTVRGQFLKCLFRNLTLPYILFGILLTVETN